jgi:hypothetical protein
VALRNVRRGRHTLTTSFALRDKIDIDLLEIGDKLGDSAATLSSSIAACAEQCRERVDPREFRLAKRHRTHPGAMCSN